MARVKPTRWKNIQNTKQSSSYIGISLNAKLHIWVGKKRRYAKMEKRVSDCGQNPHPHFCVLFMEGCVSGTARGMCVRGCGKHILSTFAHITTSRDLPVTHFLVDGKFCTGSYLRTAALNKTDFDIQDRKLPPESLQLHSSKVKERAQAEGLLRPGPSWLRH